MKKNNKKIKKVIVNSLTLSRVIATLAMPILFSGLSSISFLLLIGGILLTDALDGILARKWEVSTIFGSLFDMTADKLLGISILFILSLTYPIMFIPLILETIIGSINIKSAIKGNNGASSQIGRVKTWVIGLSMFSLILVGATPEIINSISTLDNNLLNEIKEQVMKILGFVESNKEIIENVAISSSVISETITIGDYLKQYNKVKNNENLITKEDLIKYRDYIKKVLLDEEYYKNTKDMPLYEKIIPPEYREEIKVKKLTLNENKKVDK